MVGEAGIAPTGVRLYRPAPPYYGTTLLMGLDKVRDLVKGIGEIIIYE